MNLNLPWKLEKRDSFVWGVRDKDGNPIIAFENKELADYIIQLVNENNYVSQDIKIVPVTGSGGTIIQT